MTKTLEQAKEFLRRVLGAPKRELKGTEYDQVWTMLQLMEPTNEYNNQRSYTEEYTVGKTWYRVTYWPLVGSNDLETIIEIFGEEKND